MSPSIGAVETDSTQALVSAKEWAKRWLATQAWPLWWANGADHVEGGFHEKLDALGQAVGKPTRVRVQARQIYVYAQAGRFGWDGPWRDAMRHGADFMFARHSRPDGLFRSAVSDTDSGAIDIYDQAFALFALAQLYQLGERPAEVMNRALALLHALDGRFKHPHGGYEESNPRSLPLRSNPHMHMLEALLAWVEIGVVEPFRQKAVQLVELACKHMIDPRTGAVGEFFDGDWCFASSPEGAVREPGHQFEWAYLLELSQRLLQVDLATERDRLLQFGRQHGLDAKRNVAVFSVDDQGRLADANARLWAQTEWLRACLVVAERASANEKAILWASALDAFKAVQNFLEGPAPGLWYEWMNLDGTFRVEPSPASSLYHIVSAFSELLRIEV